MVKPYSYRVERIRSTSKRDGPFFWAEFVNGFLAEWPGEGASLAV
jgi:hypothetical protein